MVSAIVGLQMGAFSVVLETFLSGKTELPFRTFVLLMQPIHLAIGVVEGLVTAAVVTFVWRARPEIIERANRSLPVNDPSAKRVLVGLTVSVIIVGGILSWFASANPDGLEWSMFRIAGTTELEAPDGIHRTLSEILAKTALLPDYSFKEAENTGEEDTAGKEVWPAVDAGTSISGIAGEALTLLLAAATGVGVNMARRRKKNVTT